MHSILMELANYAKEVDEPEVAVVLFTLAGLFRIGKVDLLVPFCVAIAESEKNREDQESLSESIDELDLFE